MPDGPAAPSVFNATGQTSGPVICSYMTGWESQGRESEETIRWTDQQIWLPGASVSVVHRCGSPILSFSICYLGILGLEGAVSCILARTSHQRTTSEKRTKVLLPKCPLFGGSTVIASKLNLNLEYIEGDSSKMLIHQGLETKERSV